ncbi:hypothetical protein ACSQ67_018874 [Phaseolus vulgaris]
MDRIPFYSPIVLCLRIGFEARCHRSTVQRLGEYSADRENKIRPVQWFILAVPVWRSSWHSDLKNGALAWQVKKMNKKRLFVGFEGDRTGIPGFSLRCGGVFDVFLFLPLPFLLYLSFPRSHSLPRIHHHWTLRHPSTSDLPHLDCKVSGPQNP